MLVKEFLRQFFTRASKVFTGHLRRIPTFRTGFWDDFPDPGNFSESSRGYVIYVLNKETWEKLRVMLTSSALIRCDGITPATVQGREMLRVDFRRVYQKSRR